jgi:hypothetical protein
MTTQRKRSRKQANQSKNDEEIVAKTYQERALENAVFGTTDISNFGKEKQQYHEKSAVQKELSQLSSTTNFAPNFDQDNLEDLFVIDTKGTAQDAESEEETHASESQSNNFQNASGEDAPAWIDESDVNVKIDLTSSTRLRKLRRSDNETVITGDEYVKRLKTVYENLNYSQKWTKSKPILEDDADTPTLESRGRAIFSHDKDFANSNKNSDVDRPLPAGRLQVLPLKDANLASPAQVCSIHSFLQLCIHYLYTLLAYG